MTLSLDGGIALLPNEEVIAVGPEEQTQSIAAFFHYGGRVVASRGTEVYGSADGGCTWEAILSASEPLRIVAPGFPWYAYGIGDRGDKLYVFFDAFADTLDIVDLPFHAVDIAPVRFSTLHALTADGRIMRILFNPFEVAWVEVGRTPVSGAPRYLAVNPGSNPDEPTHMVLAMASGPPRVTFNDGRSWTTATGIRQNADEVRTGRPRFANVFQPTGFKTNEVWIAVLRRYIEPGSGNITEQRVIAHSVDGGLSFSDAVMDDGSEVLLPDALFDRQELVVRPLVEGEVLFAGDGCPDMEPRLYHYRAEDGTVTVITWGADEILGIESLDFHPLHSSADHPDVLYIGHRAIGSCG